MGDTIQNDMLGMDQHRDMPTYVSPTSATGVPKVTAAENWVSPTPVLPGGGKQQGSPLADLFGKAFSVSDSLADPQRISADSIDTSGRFSWVNPGYDNEDIYAGGQGVFKKAGSAILKGAGLAATTFVSGTAGLLYGTASWIKDGKFSSFYNNELTRGLDEINKTLENKYLPNYYSAKERDASWYSPDNWFTANFLFDKVVKNLGFAVGAAWSGNAYSGILKSIGLSAELIAAGEGVKVAEATEEAVVSGIPQADRFSAVTSRLQDIAKKTVNKYNILDKGHRAVVAGLSTIGESSSEALNNLNEYRDKAIEEYKNGYTDDKGVFHAGHGVDPTGDALQRINERAESVGNWSFGLNTALLTGTNYIQFPKILGSSFKQEKAIANGLSTETNEIVEEAGKAGKGVYKAAERSRLGNIATRAKNIAGSVFAPSEAFEEGAQTAISMGTENYYTKKARGNEVEGLQDMFLAGVRGLNSKEGYESIMLGGLSGGLMESFHAVKHGEKSFGSIFTGSDSKELTQNTADAVTGLNKYGFIQMMKDGVASASRAIALQDEREAAIRQGNILEAKDLERDYAHNYISHRIKYGRYDLITKDIENYRKLAATEEGFTQLKSEGIVGETETQANFSRRLSNLQEHASSVNDMYQFVNLRYGGRVNDKGEKLYNTKVLDQMVYAASKIADYDNRGIQLSNELMGHGIDLAGIEGALRKERSKRNSGETVSTDPNADTRKTTNGVTDFIENALTAIEDLNVPDTAEIHQKFEDYMKIQKRREAFVKEYRELKNAPEKFQESYEEIVANSQAAQGNKPVEKIQVTTKDGDEELEVGTEYYLGKVTEHDKDGNEVYRFPKLTILGKNADGTVKVKGSDGTVKDIDPEKLKDYKLGKVSDTKGNKTANFYLQHINDVFQYNFGKDNGGRKPGRLEYDSKANKLFFVYKDGDKVKRKEVDNSHFTPQGDFKDARIKIKGKLVADTAEKKAAREAFVSDNAARKAAEENRKSQAKRDERLRIVKELTDEHLSKKDKLDKMLAAKKDELAKVKAKVQSLQAPPAKTGDRGKDFRNMQKFRKVLAASGDTLIELSIMEEDITNHIKNLQAESDELDLNISYFQDLAHNIGETEDRGRVFVEELKKQVDTLEELHKSANEEIKIAEGLIDDVKKAIKSVGAFLKKMVGRFDPEGAQTLATKFDNWMQAYYEGRFPERIADMKAAINDSFGLMGDLQKEMTVNEEDLKQIEAHLDQLQKSLEPLEREWQIKQAIYEKFKEAADRWDAIEEERRKVEEYHPQIFAQQAELAKASGTIASGDPTTETDDFDSAKPYTPNLFFRTTSPYSDNYTERQHTEQAFLNNIRNHPQRANMRAVVVTQNNEKALGLDGLVSGVIYKDGKDLTDPDKGVVAVVYVVMEGNKRFFVDMNGEKIKNDDGSLAQVTLNVQHPGINDKVMFSTMPDTSLYYNDGKTPRYRAGHEAEAKAYAEAWKKKRTEYLANTDGKAGMLPFTVSAGVPIYDEKPQTAEEKAAGKPKRYEHHSATGTGLITQELLGEADTLVISTTGLLPLDDGSQKKVPPGRPLLKVEGGLIYLNNRMLNEKEQDVLFKVIKELAKRGVKNKLDEELVIFLQNVLFFGSPKQDKDAGRNQIWINKGELYLGKEGAKVPFTEAGIEAQKETVMNFLKGVYNNVNNHTLKHKAGKGFQEITDITPEGEIKAVQWKTYQHYLLSETYDLTSHDKSGLHGEKRQSLLTTKVRPVRPELKANDSNFKAKYVVFRPTDLKVEVDLAQAKNAAKEAADKAAKEAADKAAAAQKQAPAAVGQYKTDGSENSYPLKDGKKLIFTTAEDGKISIDLENAENKEAIAFLASLKAVQTKVVAENEARTKAGEEANYTATEAANNFAYDILTAAVKKDFADKAAADKAAAEKVVADKAIADKAAAASQATGGKLDMNGGENTMPLKDGKKIIYTIEKGKPAFDPENKDNKEAIAFFASLPSIKAKVTAENEALINAGEEPSFTAENAARNFMLTILENEIKKDQAATVTSPELGGTPAATGSTPAPQATATSATPLADAFKVGDKYDVIDNLGTTTWEILKDEGDSFIVTEIKEAGSTLVPSIGTTSKAAFEERLKVADGAKEKKYRRTVAAAEAPGATQPTGQPTNINQGRFANKKAPKNYRVVSTQDRTRMTRAQLEVFKQWHRENLGNVPFETLSHLVRTTDGGYAWGVFEDGIIKFFEAAEQGTEYHEAFEAVWNSFVPQAEQRRILTEFRQRKGTFIDRVTGEEISYAKADDDQAKERIADEFADFRLRKIMPQKTGLVSAIHRFFLNLLNFFKKFFSPGSRAAQDLFDKINTGHYRSYVVPQAVIDNTREYSSVIPGFTVEQSWELNQDMSIRILDRLVGRDSSQLFDPENVGISGAELYEEIRLEMNGEMDDPMYHYQKDSVEWAAIVNQNIKYIKTHSIKFDPDTLELGGINNQDATSREYAAEAFKYDSKKNAPAPMKLLISSLPETDAKAAVEARQQEADDPFGSEEEVKERDFTVLKVSSVKGNLQVNFAKTFVRIMDTLSNTNSFELMLENMAVLARTQPNYERFLDRINANFITGKIDYSNLTHDDWRLLLSFYTTYSRQKGQGFIQRVDTTGRVYTMDANMGTASKQIQADWLETMKQRRDDEKSPVYFSEKSGMYMVNQTEVAKFSTEGIQHSLDFLNALGIGFNAAMAGRLSNEDVQKVNAQATSIHYTLMRNRSFLSVSGKTIGITGALNSLSELAARASNPVLESTMYGVHNEMLQVYALNNTLSVLANDLNEVDSLDELYERLPHLKDVFSGYDPKTNDSKHSTLLKKGGPLFDENGKRRSKNKLEMGFMAGTIDDNKDNGAKVTSKLGHGDRLMQQFNQVLNGWHYILVPADSSTEWMMKMGNPVTWEDLNSRGGWDKINEIFEGYFRDEFALAKLGSTRNKNANLQGRENKLRFFEGILASNPQLLEAANNAIANHKETADGFLNKTLGKGKDAVSIKDAINEAVRVFLESEKDKIHSRLGSYGKIYDATDTFSIPGLDSTFADIHKLNKSELSKEQYDKLLMLVNVNYVINNTEYHKVQFGDPYLYKDPTKRYKSFMSPRETSFTDPVFDRFANIRYNEAAPNFVQKEGSPDYIAPVKLQPGQPGYNTFRNHIRTVTAADVEVVGSLHMDELMPAESRGKYEKVNEADGSSISIINSYREERVKSAAWDNKTDEAQYQFEMAYARKAMFKEGHFTNYPADLQAMDEKLLEKGNPGHLTWYTTKPVGTGVKQGATFIDPILDKTSRFPLVYRVIEDHPNMKALFIKMFKEDVGYVIMESGRKTGTEKTHSLYNADGTFNDTPFEQAGIIDVSFKSTGRQVETKSKNDPKQTQGSQVTKIVTIDFMDNGMPIDLIDEDGEFAIPLDDWRSLSTKDKADLSPVFKQLMHNQELLQEKTNRGYENLLKKLGVKEIREKRPDGKETVRYEIKDIKKTQELLNEEITRRELNDNIRDSINLNKEGDAFAIPFEATNAYAQIKSVLMAVVDKTVLSPKMNGGPKVQVSALLWEKNKRQAVYKETYKENGKELYRYVKVDDYSKLTDEQKKTVRLTSNDLKFYDSKDRYMEVYLPNWFAKKLAHLGHTDEEILKKLNETEEGRKILTGVGFRIPTQGPNSIDAFRVKGFLPAEMGDTIVVPSEITMKSGSDFDIDKLNTYLKNVEVVNGKVKLIQYLTDENSTAEQRYSKYISDRHDSYQEDLRDLKQSQEYTEASGNSTIAEAKDSFFTEARSERMRQYNEAKAARDFNKQAITDNSKRVADEIITEGKDIFSGLPISIKQIFWAQEEILKSSGITGTAKTQVYKTFTAALLDEIQSDVNMDVFGQNYIDQKGVTHTENVDKAELVTILNDMMENHDELLQYRDIVDKDLGSQNAAFKKLAEDLAKAFKGKVLQGKGIASEILEAHRPQIEAWAFEAAKVMAEFNEDLPSFEQFQQKTIMQQNHSKAIENAYYESMEYFITHEKNFHRLTTPNSGGAELKGYRDDLRKLMGKPDQNKLPASSLLSMDHMVETRHNFNIGKGGTAVAAVSQTNQAQNQRSVVYLNYDKWQEFDKKELYWLSGGTKSQDITPESFAIQLPHNKVTLGGKIYATLSGIKDTAGKYISDKIAAYIDGFVDIAKDAFIVELGAAPNVAGTFLFLEKLGVPTKTVVYFMNQPIITQLLKTIDAEGKSYLFNGQIISDVENHFSIGNEPIPTTIDPSKFEDTIRNAYKDGVYQPNALSDVENAHQVAVLREFLKYAMMSSHLFEFTQGSNHDTANFGDPALYYKKLIQTQYARHGNIISDVDEAMNASFVANTAENLKKSLAAVSTFLKLSNEKYRVIMEKVLKNFLQRGRVMSDDDFIQVAKKVTASFIDYVLQVHGDYNTTTKYNGMHSQLLIDTTTAVADELAKWKDDPDISTNPVIEDMRLRLSEAPGGARNLKLKPVDNDTLTSNRYIQGFRQLRDNARTRSLYDNILTLTLLQSGTQTSPISFTNLIPIEDFAKIMGPIMDKLDTLSNLHNYSDNVAFFRNSWKNNEYVPAITIKENNADRLYFNTHNKVQALAASTGTNVATVPFYLAGQPVIKYSTYHENEEGKRVYNTTLLQRVDYKEGQPLMVSVINKKTGRVTPHIYYKQINAWGDGFGAQEYYNDRRQSVYVNNTWKTNELSNQQIFDALGYDSRAPLAFAEEQPSEEAPAATKTTATPSAAAQSAGWKPITKIQQEITEKLPQVGNPSAKAHFPKEQIKTRMATQYIGAGSAGSSTDRYMKLYGEYKLANTGNYDLDDVVYVSSNGNRGGRVNPVVNGKLQGVYQNIDKAIAAGATIVMDTAAHIASTKNYNIGEVALAQYMSGKGYVRNDSSGAGVWTPTTAKEDQVLKTAATAKTINIYAGAGENAELSNFAIRPFEAGNIMYNSVEHAFQDNKFTYSTASKFNQALSEKIIASKNPAEAKKLGNQFQGFEVAKWEKDRSGIMKDLIKESFIQNPAALQKLLATGTATLTHTQDKTTWGTEFPKLLMEVRSELSKGVTKTSAAPKSTATAQQVAMDQQIVNNILTDGSYFYFPTEKAMDENKMVRITRDNLQDAMRAYKELGDALANERGYVMGIPEPVIELPLAGGSILEVFGFKNLEKTIANTDKSNSAEEVEAAKRMMKKLMDENPAVTQVTQVLKDRLDGGCSKK